MRRLLVLTSALALIGCSDFVVEPNATADRDLVVGPRRFISGVTWTLSSTNVDMIALGQFDGKDTYPLDVNDSRQVVGSYYRETEDGPRAHAFIWEDGVYTDLGTLGGSVSFAHQISNSGVIVGWSYNASGQRRPAVWRNGVISELPAPAGEPEGVGSARAINSNGDIVGYYGKNAVKWTSTGTQIIGVLPGAETSEAFGVNGQGVIFGSAFNTAVKLPWLWSNGTFTELTLPERSELSGALTESGRVFNDAGHFLGTVTDENWNTRGFVYRDGQAHILPHPSANTPDGYSVALGLNEAGDVAGLDLASNWTWRAVVWPRTGAPVDLGYAPGGFMSRASGINNGIFAVGVSYDDQNRASGVLWKWLVDRTSPVVSGSVQGTLGANGWYVSNVDVSWTITEVESAIKSSEGCGPSSISADSPGLTLTCTVTNNVDLTSSATVTVKRDVTAPSVMYEGNAGTYGVDQTIAIMCSPSDATSGIDTHTCQPVTGEALAFGLGRHTFSATATDRAGHSASGSTAFTVELTLGGLAGLTRRYATDAQAGELLARFLEVAAQFREHGNSMPAELLLRVYVAGVQFQIGRALSAEHGALLLQLSKTFVDTRASRQKPKTPTRGKRR